MQAKQIGRETKATENTNPQTRVPQRLVRGRADLGLGALGGGRTRRRPVGHAGSGVPDGATGDGVAGEGESTSFLVQRR